MNLTEKQLQALIDSGQATVTGTVKLPVEPVADLPERPLSEKEFMWKIIAFAEANGWDYYHTYDSRRSKPGYPDLHLWTAGRMLWIETKTEKGKLTADQERVHASLRAAGAQVLVVRPSDWEEVQRVLRRTT